MAKGGNVMQESVNKVVESEETAGHIEVPVTAELKADEPEDKEPEAEEGIARANREEGRVEPKKVSGADPSAAVSLDPTYWV